MAERRKEDQSDDGEGGDEDGEGVEAEAGGHTDGGDEPDVRGGRETLHVVFRVDDGPGAEKADARDDPRRDAGGVDPAHRGKAFYGENGEEAGAHGDDEIGSEPCGTPAQVPLRPHDRSEEGREEDLPNSFHRQRRSIGHKASIPYNSLMQERLQKILSGRGICSRRKAEEYILQGLVKVNGKAATLGQKADPEADRIEVDGTVIEARKELLYYVMNKPVGVETSNVARSAGQSTSHEKSVRDLLPRHLQGKIFPVGRLDKDTSGLLLFTNDGVLAYRLTHPKFDHEKEYEVILEEPIFDGALQKLGKGVTIDGTKTKPARIERLGESRFRIALTEGRNRQIRRMVQKVGSAVRELRRVRIMTLVDHRLKAGELRPLTEGEREELLRSVGL